MLFSIIQLALLQLVLPLIFIWALWKGRFQTKTEWAVQSLCTIMLVVWAVLSGRWDMFSYYLRLLLPVLLIVAVYRSYRKNSSLPWWTAVERTQKWSIGIYALLGVVFAWYNVSIISGYAADEPAAELTFPLENGTYYTAHGGSQEQINYHQAVREQQYALDILQLNAFGMRASGLYPNQLDRYAIYGETLHSPCTGEVLEVERGLDDQKPPQSDPENPNGNYVRLACDNTEASVYLSHMREGSVTVSEGEQVQEEQEIGRVGNSGNTTEPHLHIHAEKNGEGVPITFQNRFLVRNSLVW